MYTCYLITNVANNKKYVGVTKEGLAIRWIKHCSDAKRNSKFLLHKAIRKYGTESFILTILEENIPQINVETFEQQKILEHNSMYITGYGYNMTVGGRVGRGDGKRKPLTEEHKRKISDSNKGKHGRGEKRNHEIVERARLARIKNHKPTHTTPHTEATKQRLREANLGKRLSEETRHKMSIARKGKKQSSKTIAKRIGRKHSEQTKHLMSEKAKIREALKRMQTTQ